MSVAQKSPDPPRWATYLLRWLVAPHRLDELEGDLDELFQQRMQQLGLRRARWRYVRDVVSLLRPALMKREVSRYPKLSYTIMLQNYVKIAWRNIAKHKAFSAINIAGLALGMTCSMLIWLWVQDERNMDAFHANKAQLFRVYMREYFSGSVQGVIWTPGPLADELKKSIPEIQYATAYEWPSKQAFSVGDKVNKQELNAVGPNFFKMFSFKLLQGTPDAALNNRNGLAISRSMAETFFGSPEAAMGKLIRYDNRKDMLVTAVFEDMPRNSTLQFDCLRNWDAFVEDDNGWAKGWGSTDPLTFFMIRPDADPAKVSAKIQHLLDKFNRDSDKPFRTQLAMQPFHEYYLHSNFKNAEIDGGRIEYVRLFTVVAIAILLIACINFINLVTARSARRAKEVGVRKVVGAVRAALIGQFIGEALLLTMLSVCLAFLLVALLLPVFNQLTGKQISLPIGDVSFWGIWATLTLLTSLIAGSYPAFFLSALNPIQVLKGTLSSAYRYSGLRAKVASTWLRQGLVVVQFSLSLILIVGVIIVHQQVEYVQNKNLGYDRENLIYFPLEGDLAKNYDVLKTELAQTPGVLQLSQMTASPASNGSGTESIHWTGSNPTEKVRFTPLGVGYDFVKTMNITLREGRDFSADFSTDSSGVLINEAALKVIGYKNPVGKTLTWGDRQVTIIGVLNDFHFQSLHERIRPLIAGLRIQPPSGNVIVRIEAGKTPTALAHIERIYKQLNPKFPFTYTFTDQEYARQYQSEQVVSQLSNYFAFIALFIACIGLFGLAAFTAERRRKEIGVRKVLGASVSNVVALLSGDVLKSVGLAILIASPLAWYAMNQWLQGFAYRIDMAWWVFVIAGLLVVGIALLTISFQSIKAALVNPVKSLRSE